MKVLLVQTYRHRQAHEAETLGSADGLVQKLHRRDAGAYALPRALGMRYVKTVRTQILRDLRRLEGQGQKANLPYFNSTVPIRGI